VSRSHCYSPDRWPMLVVAVNNSLSGKFEDLLSKMLESLYSKKAVEKKRRAEVEEKSRIDASRRQKIELPKKLKEEFRCSAGSLQGRCGCEGLVPWL
jgi:hypothetical protein